MRPNRLAIVVVGLLSSGFGENDGFRGCGGSGRNGGTGSTGAIETPPQSKTRTYGSTCLVFFNDTQVDSHSCTIHLTDTSVDMFVGVAGERFACQTDITWDGTDYSGTASNTSYSMSSNGSADGRSSSGKCTLTSKTPWEALFYGRQVAPGDRLEATWAGAQ